MWTEEQRQFAQEWATEALFRFLTDNSEDRTKEYIEETVKIVQRGSVRLKGRGPITYISEEDWQRRQEAGEPLDEEQTRILTISENRLSLLSLRLARSFGEDGNVHGDLSTWSEAAGFAMGLMVDYRALADRLLKRYVLEYVPSETERHDDDEDDEDDDFEGDY